MFYENLGLFLLILLVVRLSFILWQSAHQPATQSQPQPQSKTARPLKPRTPQDCPVCGRPHPTPLWGNVRKPGVLPWSERKSRRGRPKTICTAGLACPAPGCEYQGNTDPTYHAVVANGVRGADGIQQFKCQCCKTCFSSRLNTALYRLRTPSAQVAQVLLAVNLGLTVADVQLLFGQSDTTLRLWLTRAGSHAEKVQAHFFHHLRLGHLQLDELFTTLRSKAHDLWVWVAFDPVTKIMPALQVGPRTQNLAYALIHAVTLVLAPGCLPVFTSDGLNLYFYALTAHFGHWELDSASGKPRWLVAADLLYAQVKKSYRRRKLARVERCMRLGSLDHLTARLKSLGLTGSINTSFVERINLTLRHALAALSRRSWATAQLSSELVTHLEWWRAYYHFCRSHQSLRLQLDVPQVRRGAQTPRRFLPRTPAMAAGLTDHIWCVQELLAFPVG